MRTLYFECNMGAAGDMLMSALSELTGEPEKIINKLNLLGLNGVRAELKQSVKCGITGTNIDITVHSHSEESHDVHNHNHEHNHEHNHVHHHEHNEHNEHHHTSLNDMLDIINKLDVSDFVKTNASAIYKLIAEAESRVHNKPVGEVHFHEVGAMDAVADIVGNCLFIEEIKPDRIISSAIETGTGSVKCAHGILPVPAPATAEILKGIPIKSRGIQGELCTPTGAAILKHFAAEFKSLPEMKISKIGYGMGKKDFEAANCVRAFLGEDDIKSEVIEINCNLDDMTGEALGYAAEILIKMGALDVFLTPIFMKKGRPAYLLSLLCEVGDEEKFTELILKHTTTFGVRSHICNRKTLTRRTEIKSTAYGDVREKIGTLGNDISKSKYEYQDIAEIAEQNDIDFSKVIKTL